jgi:DNA repair protein SbcC/Rad50
MLQSLDYSVTFPSTGKSLSGQFEFENGLTAITGQNETGKSIIMEMARYCLFGTAALRGNATEYKGLTATLGFGVKGTKYRVNRNGPRVMLSQDETTIASGTRAVNAKIIELLGYDMVVFDVANSCNQGAVEALGAMTSGERKKMVDQTIGLTTLDDLSKTVAEKATVEKRTAEVLDEGLVEPTAPVQPPLYVPSNHLKVKQKKRTADVAKLNQHRGWLAQPVVPKPAEPTCAITETAAVLIKYQGARQKLALRLSTLQGQLKSLRETRYTAKELKKLEYDLFDWRFWQEKQRFEKANPLPAYTREQLDEATAQLNEWTRWETKLGMVQQRDEALSHGLNHCPKCEHEWPLLASQVDAVNASLEPYADLVAEPPKPILTMQEIMWHTNARALELTTASDRKRLAKATECKDPGIDEAGIAKAKAAFEDAERRIAINKELATITVPDDRAKDVLTRQKYEFALGSYADKVMAYDAHTKERSKREAEVAALVPSEAAYKTIGERLNAAQVYENELAVFTKRKADFDLAASRGVEARAKAEQYELAKDAIKELKVRVKAFLVPSLNKVASLLIAQMTNGARRRIVIDEDFNIAVDGQPLNTLSGSG